MGLTEYVKKRDFKKTAEPQAGKSKDKDHLIFVVQKHDASHLHYDFRLEMTIAYYALGGLVTALTIRALRFKPV